MRPISVKFEDNFLQDLEMAMKLDRYTTKTEFIRVAVREKIEDIEKKEALKRLINAYGAGKKRHKDLTDKDLHRAREEAFKEMAKDFGVKLD
ncbi:hypothetical protein HYV89_05705 [Candidatus Woesearchaeota archaeon]|nr:hypothetical protein [Candidatus Woesearchaeota archaeon]